MCSSLIFKYRTSKNGRERRPRRSAAPQALARNDRCVLIRDGMQKSRADDGFITAALELFPEQCFK